MSRITIRAIVAIGGLTSLVLSCNTLAGSIVSNLNNKCLDVPGGNFKSSQALQMYDCNNTNAQNFTQFASGEIKINGLCVDAWGGHGNNGDRVGLYQCNGGGNQRWISANGRLIGMNGRCMDISGGNRNNGAIVVLWNCNKPASANQSWRGIGNNAAGIANNQVVGVNPQILTNMNISVNSMREAAALTAVAPLSSGNPLTSVSPMH